MRVMRVAQLTALTMGLAFAMPAAAETAAEIDAAVKTAREVCLASVPGCKEAAAEAEGMLVFPTITKGAIGIGGSYGEGALLVGDKTGGTTAAPVPRSACSSARKNSPKSSCS